MPVFAQCTASKAPTDALDATTARARSLPGWALCAALLVGGGPAAQAQMFSDAALQALHERPDGVAELQQAAKARLAANRADTQAVLALGVAALARNDAPERRRALDEAERCTREQPQVAACHYALGMVLGAQAMSDGLLKAAGSAGLVKASLVQALTLAPQWYPARSALQEFYLLAPGFMGGSTAKAQELARAAATAEQARVLQARVELQAGRQQQVMQIAGPLLASPDRAVAEDAAAWGFSAALQLINDERAAEAEPFLHRLARQRPETAGGPFGLARVRVADGQHEQALQFFDQAARAADHARFPIEYRRGLSLQALGRNDEARAAFRRFIDSGRGQKRLLDDARKRLQTLG